MYDAVAPSTSVEELQSLKITKINKKMQRDCFLKGDFFSKTILNC